MKNKHIWLIIGCILIAGVLITRYTNSIITSKEVLGAAAAGAVSTSQEAEGAMAEGPEVQGPAAPGPGRSAETAASQGELTGTLPAAAGRAAPGGPGSPGGERAAAIAQDRADSGEAVTAYAETAPGPVSPIEGLHGKNDPGYPAQPSDYRQRLVDLDNQIHKLREEDKDATAYTLKNTAESELKLWESEMSSIYGALMDRMPQQEAADLAAEQQEWLKSREARAAEQNSKINAANLESVGYITALVSITRDRTYELVGRYEELTTGDSGT